MAGGPPGAPIYKNLKSGGPLRLLLPGWVFEFHASLGWNFRTNDIHLPGGSRIRPSRTATMTMVSFFNWNTRMYGVPASTNSRVPVTSPALPISGKSSSAPVSRSSRWPLATSHVPFSRHVEIPVSAPRARFS